MPEVTRVVRDSYTTRRGDRDDYSSDDGRSVSGRSRHGGGGGSYHTVQRYRVAPGRVEEVEDDRRSSRLEPQRAERVEIDRRVERFTEPERPRSAIDHRPRSSIVERYVERDRDPIRSPDHERSRTVVYDYERERDHPREPDYAHPWDRDNDRDRRTWDSERDVRESDVRIEKRVERRETTDRRDERREEPYEVERYQRETEYYDRPEPTPPPIIIRQRAPEPQQIIVQEAPQPPPIVLPREEQQKGFEVIRRAEVHEPRRDEDEYYYRRDVREIAPSKRDDNQVAAYDRRGRRSPSDEAYSEDDVVIKRRTVTRERSESHSSHHKRHLAEGALAGAGAAALLANHKSKKGNGSRHRGRSVVGGAALGAIGAEVATRARSRYREHKEARSRSRSRSKSKSRHPVVKTALGLAVAGIAAAAAVKYVQNRKVEKEELSRGRSRTRSASRRRGSRHGSHRDSSDSEGEVTKSRHSSPKHRAAQIAKAGAATAAVAGVVQHFRNKSKSRDGARSKSKIRTGAEIAGAGLAGAAVAGLYENRKAKAAAEEEEEERLKRERRKARRAARKERSRARSAASYSDTEHDPEQGMVEYGTDPVHTQMNAFNSAHGYDPAYGATRSHGRGHRHRNHSSSSEGGGRSRSRVRDIAGAAAATGAAAIGVHKYRKRRQEKEDERERDRRRYEEAPPENYYASHNDYRDGEYSPSPPHASGGSYLPHTIEHPPAPAGGYYPNTTEFPPPPTGAAAPPPPGGFTQHAAQSTMHLPPEAPIPPYNPQDYANQQGGAHDSHGFPAPRPGDNVSTVPPVSANVLHAASGRVPYFPPPPTSPIVPNEQQHLRDGARIANPGSPLTSVDTPLYTPSASPPLPANPPQTSNKSVNFAPLSPTSSARLAQIHRSPTPEDLHEKRHHSPTSPDDGNENYDDNVYDDPSSPDTSRHHHHHHRHQRRRRNTDPSSDRPNQPSKHRRRARQPTRSPSPDTSDGIEELPPRFDRDGHPINRGPGNAGVPGSQHEMVERIAKDFSDVVDGRKNWKDLLRGFVEQAASAGASGSGGERERRRGHD